MNGKQKYRAIQCLNYVNRHGPVGKKLSWLNNKGNLESVKKLKSEERVQFLSGFFKCLGAN